MEKLILRSKSKAELKEKVKNMLTLNEDETIEIVELSKPFKFLFFSKDGEYEVKIVKKSEITNKSPKKEKINEKVNKPEIKVNSAKEEKPKKVENKENKVEKNTKISERLNVVIKEFLAISNLDVKIESIKVKDSVYNIDLVGDDIRYIIGEKGIALSSLEYLLMSLEEFKHVKIFIDSNNYKEKREGILRELANKTAKNVLKTQRKVKLNPMNSRERKIIHEEISKIPGLETVSVGVEPKRCLIIKLKNKK
ncbi:R3H domain-containing nucleic acid-binding protein [Pseudostreptobacillus hongkongensis]|uniref:Jag family protein n=1 Tax=Pseudostreptobacillus hongkongensis TaxID=1162717 RepID=UPI0028D6FCD4|nr:R3H domain-containing nucleic acid-binding protein [Pseudostreptobacillus hongkongensis]